MTRSATRRTLRNSSLRLSPVVCEDSALRRNVPKKNAQSSYQRSTDIRPEEPEVLRYIGRREIGVTDLRDPGARSLRDAVRGKYAAKHPTSVKEFALGQETLCKYDKAFAVEWLSSSQVLVGTKDNQLVSIPLGSPGWTTQRPQIQNISLPLIDPELLTTLSAQQRRNRSSVENCGVHCMYPSHVKMQ